MFRLNADRTPNLCADCNCHGNEDQSCSFVSSTEPPATATKAFTAALFSGSKTQGINETTAGLVNDVTKMQRSVFFNSKFIYSKSLTILCGTQNRKFYSN